jgi:hypothetical protein
MNYFKVQYYKICLDEGGFFGAADGLSELVRGGRTGWQRAAVAPKVASSPRATIRRPPCGQASSIPAAGPEHTTTK